MDEVSAVGTGVGAGDRKAEPAPAVADSARENRSNKRGRSSLGDALPPSSTVIRRCCVSVSADRVIGWAP